MSLLLISQAYSISDNEDEASEVQVKKSNECLENAKNHGGSQNVKSKNKFRPGKLLKPINLDETQKENAACETSPNLFEQWPFSKCKIVFNCKNENGAAAGIKINENSGELENGGWKKEDQKFVFYEEMTSTNEAYPKGSRDESITTADKQDETKVENEDQIFTSSFLDLLDQMENKISEKTTVEEQIVGKKPPPTKKRRLEMNHLNVSATSGNDVNFEVCDKIQQAKTLATNQCIMCCKQFNKHSNLKRHILTHIQEKPYFCNVCNESFAHLSTLKSHKLIHTGKKPYKCMVCNKSFFRTNHLKSHQRIHSREKPFCCSFCSASFTQLINLKSHERIHSGEKPYQCTICSKRFANSSTLKRHERVHTNEKPCQCLICGKRFAYKFTLKRHTKSHNEFEY